MPNRIVVHFLQTHGNLHILREIKREVPHRRRVECICDCLEIVEADLGAISAGQTRSCGCLSFKLSVTSQKRGVSQTLTYKAWTRINKRCHDPRSDKWEYYGGRGIIVCPEWRHDFTAFLSDVGECPGPEYSIDRWPDQNGNYEKNNTRWATKIQQMRNKRCNIWTTYKGKPRLMVEVCEELSLPYFAIRKRYLKGQQGDRLFRPIREHKKYKARIKPAGVQ